MQTVNTLNKQSTNGVVYKANHLMHLSLEEMMAIAKGYVPANLNEAEVGPLLCLSVRACVSLLFPFFGVPLI